MKRIFTLFISLFIVSVISQAQPTTQANNITITPITGTPNQLKFDWTAGNGANKVLVVINEAANSTFTPTGGTSYAGNLNFGAGPDIGVGGGLSKSVLFNSTATTVTVSGLSEDKDYLIQIFEYTGAQAYNVSPAQNNPRTFRYHVTASTVASWWTAPTAITKVTAQVWGGGGASGGADSNPDNNKASGGGGAGGAYVQSIVTTVPTTAYAVSVGAGGTIGAAGADGNKGTDSYFITTLTVLAEGGDFGRGSVGNGTVGAGGTGSIASSVGTTKNKGGDGAVGQNSGGKGGGGGTSGGVGGNGTSATDDNGATGVAGAGNGGDGINNNNNGNDGFYPGGGAGGAADNNATPNTGGAGGDGLAIISFSRPNAPGNPTAAAGPVIDFSENNAGFTIVVPGLLASGAGNNDILTILQDGVAIPTASPHTLTQAEINTGSYSFTGVKLTGTDGVKNITAFITNVDGNVGPSNAAPLALTLAAAATVTGVSSTTGDGTYGFGKVIDITVTFNRLVTVSAGTPQLLLETGAVDRNINYTSGSPGTVLTFQYTVQDGDVSGDLDYNSAAALTLNGSTIVDGAGNNASLALVTPGTSGSLAFGKALVITGDVPVVVSVTTTQITGTYGIGVNIPVTVTFSTPVTVNTGGGIPTLQLNSGKNQQYTSGSGTAALLFDYTVAVGETTSGGNLDYSATTSLVLNSGTIKRSTGANPDALLTLASPGTAGSISNTKAIIVDGVQPKVTNVTSALADNTYYFGKVIDITVTFDKSVTVASGTPQLLLETGAVDQNVNYFSGSPGTVLTFRYIVQDGDVSADLNYNSTTALTFNGATIKDALGNNADLTLPGLAAAGSLATNKNLVIAGDIPIVLSVTTTQITGTYGIGVNIPITVTFSTPVTVNTGGGTPTLQLSSGKNQQYTSGSGTAALLFDYTVAAGETTSGGNLDYSATTSLVLNLGTIKRSTGANPDAILTLASPGAAGSISNSKAIIVDGIRPVVTSTISGAQILKAGASSASNFRSSKAGTIYFVNNTQTIGNVFANITTALGTKDAFIEKAGAAAATLYTMGASGAIAVPGSGVANDGTYDIVAVDALGNVSNQFPGWLTIDNSAPTATSAPTTVASPTIDGSEYTAGFIVNVAALDLTGAKVNDQLELLLGGASFPAPILHTLTNAEINTAKNVDLTVVCGQMGADAVGKLITARITDVAGNVGAVSPNLSVDVATVPTTPATTMGFGIPTTSSVTVNWINGDGTNRILVVNQGSAVTFVPSDFTTYAPDPNFATSPNLGGGKVVGSASGVNVTNLPSGDQFFFAVYEFNNCAPHQRYFSTALTGSISIPAGSLTTVSTGGGTATLTSLQDTKAEALAALGNFTFQVKDDGATAAVDIAPTRITSITINRDILNDQTSDWTTVIAGVVLDDGAGHTINSVDDPTYFPPGFLTLNSIVISSIPSALPTDIGYVADDATKTYSVKIWLNTSITALDIDNKRLVFNAINSGFTTAAVNSSNFTASSATSGAGNNAVTVVADRLVFTNLPASGAAGTGFSLDIAATDVNGNVDLNQNQQVTIDLALFPVTGIISFTNAAPNNAAQNMVGGRRSWTNVKVTAGGAGALGNYRFRVNDTDVTAPTLTASTSGIINFTAPSNASTIVGNTGYSSNPFDYKSYQHTPGFTLGVPPPADAIRVGQFAILDGGGSPDADAIGTTLTAISLNVTNPGNLQYLGLSDGVNMVATQPASALVSFSGFAILGEDVDNGGSGFQIFDVYASFKPIVTDNVHFEFQVNTVATGNGGSTFAFPDGAAGAGGAKSTTTPTQNLVQVTADRLAFVQQPPASLFIGNAMAPALTIQATDILGSRDLDITTTANMTSTGSLSTAPAANLVSGFGTYSAVTHSATATARTVSTTNVAGLINATSTAFDLTASSNSTITANALFGPSNIAYDAAQESADIINSTSSVVVAEYTLHDGGGASDPDGAPTRLTGLTLDLGANWNYIRRIALYNSAGTAELAPNLIGFSEQPVIGQTVSFSGLNLVAADDGANIFTVRVSFTQNVVDNQQFQFTVTGATTQALTSSTFAAPDAGGAITPITGNINRIEVTASKLKITNPFISVVLAVKDISPVQQATPPVIKAVDQFDLTDLDYATNITFTSTASPSTTTLIRDNPAPNAGVYTFPSTFQFGTVGTGTLTNITSGALPVIPSSSVINVVAGTASVIAAGVAAPLTVVSTATTAGTAAVVFHFDVIDDKTPIIASNDDGLPTLISSVVITAGGSNAIDFAQAFAGAILEDQALNSQTVLAGPAITGSPSTNSITFSGINTGTLGFVGDGLTKNYTLKVFFKPSLGGTLPATIDGQQFDFQVSTVGGIGIAANSTGTIASSTSSGGGKDVVTVAATQLKFIFPTGAASASLNTPIAGIAIEATDINNNRDLNFASTITAFSNQTGATMVNGPTVGVSAFSNISPGVFNFNAGFKYTTGANGDNVSFSMTAGGLTITPATTPASPTITLLSSFESMVVGDPTFTFAPTLDYVNHHETLNIQNTATSLEIARMLLVDGSKVNFPVGASLLNTPDNDGFPANDVDGASTVLNTLTIRITRPSNLQRLELWSGGSPISTEINVAAIGGITSATATFDFVFSGIAAAPLITALDDNVATISVRASFRNTAPEVTDSDPIQLSIVGASLNAGSSFFPGAGFIAGVNGGLVSPVMKIDVVTTKFDFTTQPGSTAGINYPIAIPGIVSARDQNSILDTGFNGPAIVNAPVIVNGAFAFTNGLLDLSSMLYGAVGDGTLTVTVGPITSNMSGTVNGLPNNSISCSHVDVINVTGNLATGGVITSTNLIGNSFGKIIFGVTFSAPTPAPVVGQPLLNGFTISFSNSTTNVLQGFVVYESTSTTYSGATSTDVTTFGGILSSSSLGLTVIFPTPRDISVTPLTYFLQVDINANATGSTPPIQPSVNDDGVFGSGTDGNIVSSVGSSSAAVAGQTYTFASIFPPILTSSYPATGQLNVDPNQPTIGLTFSVPVWTLDNKIMLFDQTAATAGVICPIHPTPVGGNGQYINGTGGLLGTILFDIPIALIPNHIYYVNIAPGNLTNLTGLMDQANNTYPGFTYSGTLYFKVASNIPPVLLGANTVPVAAPSDPVVSNISLTGAVINATFDEQGTAYYLVLANGSVPPTNAQIKNPAAAPAYPTPANIKAIGNFTITQTNPVSQFGVIIPNNPGPVPPAGQFAPSTIFNVWMYAENNALPIPFSVASPYGAGPGFAVGAAGPTLNFTTPASSPAGVSVSAPSIRVCNNSFQTLNAPIIISEGATNNFFTSVSNPSVTLNIGLPAGFQFDVSRTAGVPTYGKIQLLGSDFTAGSGTIKFLSSSIVSISYKNAGSTSLDKIIISGLRVLSTSSTSGSMFRIGGTALTGPIPDNFSMGTIISFDAPIIGFDNSYSKTALGNTPTNVVTSIPDNGDDLDPLTAPFTVQLTPYNTNITDFGPNNFTGTGVNVNILSLQAATPDVPFNITVTHTDNNGCISQNPVQYTVYDHKSGIKVSTTVPNQPVPITALPPASYVQSPFCITNDKFINSTAAANPYNAPTYGKFSYIAFNNLAGYYLRSTSVNPAIVAKIPTNAGPQIISGAAWGAIINTLPVAITGSVNDQANIPGPAPQPYTENFKYDVSKILDANTLSGGSIPDPYSNFRSSVTAQGNYYYDGGSLGKVEFTGTFQSATNATVIVPRTQVVEFFLPAVPLVEINPGNRTFLDVADPANPVGSYVGYPSAINGPTNRGTPIYCQAGGIININGFPSALVGSSVGSFALFDVSSGNPIVAPVGFVDNGNGTATLDPNVPLSAVAGTYFDPAGKSRNSYKDIKIVYTYQANNSPCPSSAYQIIRITPNPVASITWSTNPTTANAPTSTAQCAGQAIKFVSTTAMPVGADPTASVTQWEWDFGDVTGQNNLIPMGPAVMTQNHTFQNPSGQGSHYQIIHRALSNYGCQSGPPVTAPAIPAVADFVQLLDIGGIPVVKYKLDGVSTGDLFRFNSNDTPTKFGSSAPYTPVANLPSGNTTVSQNDIITQYDWDFGDGGAHGIVSGITTGYKIANGIVSDFTTGLPFAITPAVNNANISGYNSNVATHNYATATNRQVNLTVTSLLGCQNSLIGAYRDIVILSRVVLPAAIPPSTPAGVYVEDFESGSGNWQAWGTGSTSAAISAGAASKSWQQLALAAGVPTPPSGTKYWKTQNGIGQYNPGEKSALYSPSFDVHNLTRPMISFNSIVQTNISDGVVLEYSTDDLNIADPNKKWLSLGTLTDGEDWYTAQGIAGRPGTQAANDYGWSGFLNDPNAPANTPLWIAPKHTLDAAYPPLDATSNPSKMVFRFALGSAATAGTTLGAGFALDNVRIGDRTRTILLESFANASNTDPTEKQDNTDLSNFVSGFVGTEVIKINYHVDFPNKEPFNLDNPADPSARALFYKIDKTPKSALDGRKDDQDRAFQQWVPSTYAVRTLQLAQADINIVVTSGTDGQLHITPDVTASVLTGIPSNTVLHIAVLEQSILKSDLPAAKQSMIKSGETSFGWVLKKLVPDASGIPFGAVLPFGTKRTFSTYSWAPDPTKLYPNPGDLAVAVWLQQDVSPFEVYQVDIIKAGIADPPVVTALEPIPVEKINVYPIPADHEMHIQLPGVLSQPATIQMVDQVGRISVQEGIQTGASSKVINTRDLSSGVYILQIDVGNGNITRKKVMIVH